MLRDTVHIYGPAASVLTEENLARMYGVPVRRIEIHSGDETISAIVPRRNWFSPGPPFGMAGTKT